MAKADYPGACALCGFKAGKAGVRRHVLGCAARHDARTGNAGRVLQLRVEAEYGSAYWLDLEIKGRARLYDLDAFLRRIWLECCNHLSAFEINKTQHMCEFYEPRWGDERSMNEHAEHALPAPGVKFKHRYDFGSTTCLVLRVAGEREGRIGGKPVRLLARNDPLVWPCAVCQQPATQICSSCSYGPEPFFCDIHATEHECGEEMMLPVVNSPRMGVCCYTGKCS